MILKTKKFHKRIALFIISLILVVTGIIFYIWNDKQPYITLFQAVQNLQKINSARGEMDISAKMKVPDFASSVSLNFDFNGSFEFDIEKEALDTSFSFNLPSESIQSSASIRIIDRTLFIEYFLEDDWEAFPIPSDTYNQYYQAILDFKEFKPDRERVDYQNFDFSELESLINYSGEKEIGSSPAYIFVINPDNKLVEDVLTEYLKGQYNRNGVDQFFDEFSINIENSEIMIAIDKETQNLRRLEITLDYVMEISGEGQEATLPFSSLEFKDLKYQLDFEQINHEVSIEKPIIE